MRSEDKHNGQEGETYHESRFLEEADRTPKNSRRNLARKLGIAPGVTDVLVRNVSNTGYVRMARVSRRQRANMVSPAGFAIGILLTIPYVSWFLDQYRRVRELIGENLNSLALTTDSCIAITG